MDPRAGRSSWLVTTGAMLVAVAMYGTIAAVLDSAGVPRPDAGAATLRLPFLITGALSGVASVWWMFRRALRDPSGAPRAPREFMFQSLVANALGETPAILGFVLVMLGATFGDYLVFGGMSAALFLGLLLPAGLRYWRQVIGGG